MRVRIVLDNLIRPVVWLTLFAAWVGAWGVIAYLVAKWIGGS